VFNIGVGVVGSHVEDSKGHHRMLDVNLRQVFDRFCEAYAPAHALMAGGQMLGGLKGAPLRFTLTGARFTRPGMLVAGEAAGSTYSFTGEGIGKALETGMLAAAAVLQGRAQSQSDAAVREHYEASLLALKPRFELYERANRVNAHPWLMDLVIWRAGRSARLLKRMSGVLNESSNPGQLFSVKGFTRLFTE
jgi:menaquinone-9 beta-reductase